MATRTIRSSANTIYTLDVQVQSIEGDESLNANLEIHDWDDAVIDIGRPLGRGRDLASGRSTSCRAKDRW